MGAIEVDVVSHIARVGSNDGQQIHSPLVRGVLMEQRGAPSVGASVGDIRNCTNCEEMRGRSWRGWRTCPPPGAGQSAAGCAPATLAAWLSFSA